MADFSALYWSRHIFAGDRHWMDREAAVALKKLKMVSMPSRAYTSFLRYPLQKSRFYAVFRACFCRLLSEYSDNSSFSCMLTFWTYLMRYTYPWHWIKYSTKYNRCHPIFSLSWQVELSSNTLPSRAATQTPLHKMYTFVYKAFIKFILFCRGQALFAGRK